MALGEKTSSRNRNTYISSGLAGVQVYSTRRRKSSWQIVTLLIGIVFVLVIFALIYNVERPDATKYNTTINNDKQAVQQEKNENQESIKSDIGSSEKVTKVSFSENDTDSVRENISETTEKIDISQPENNESFQDESVVLDNQGIKKEVFAEKPELNMEDKTENQKVNIENKENNSIKAKTEDKNTLEEPKITETKTVNIRDFGLSVKKSAGKYLIQVKSPNTGNDYIYRFSCRENNDSTTSQISPVKRTAGTYEWLPVKSSSYYQIILEIYDGNEFIGIKKS